MNDAVTESKKEKQVTTEIMRLEVYAGLLRVNIECLEEILGRVLTPATPCAEPTSQGDLVPLASRLQGSVDNVQQQNNIILNILNRLEL